MNFASWTVWSGLAIAGGAFIAAWLSRRTKISEFRQDWIDGLRQDIADYVGASEQWIYKFDEFNSMNPEDENRQKTFAAASELSIKARIILYRIKLRINPRENKYKNEDHAFLKSLEDLLDPGKVLFQDFDASWRKLADNAVNLGRELLKREWEVTKSSFKR